MRTTKLITISLPSDLLKEIEQIARKEHRTRSEFVRETVRQYLAKEEWRGLHRYARSVAGKAGVKSEKDIDRLVNESRCGQSND